MRTLRALKSTVRDLIGTYHPDHREALQLSRVEAAQLLKPVAPSHQHLDAAIGWIKRAQDSTPTGGVAWGYCARPPFPGWPLHWVGPYPETTGYIIPTMLRYADLTGDEDSVARALRMTEWEMSIQLPDGGLQGGVFGEQPVASSTFVTGQVLFGFVAAYKRFGGERIRTAAVRAGDFLLDCLDESGRFVKGHSHFCAAGSKAYEARTGLALAELGDMTGEKRFRHGASRTADYAIAMQQQNGWFWDNDLDHHDRPLTHTIGYVLEGLHGIGRRLNRPECVRAVERTLDAIVPLIPHDGFLAGRLRSDWSPAADWACLTGSAQIAGVFLRMYTENAKPEYLDAGRKLLGFVCATQDVRIEVPGLIGGIRGSYPFGGGYGTWCVLNWATKFFADSVMDYLEMMRGREVSSGDKMLDTTATSAFTR
ncbi:MAG: hypothetical protein JO061_21365 [Acidobacteriaceae bacterium]|nr:hypothetical protein [Acidobacteriaceae bacterium]